jgi:hypothetical protein
MKIFYLTLSATFTILLLSCNLTLNPKYATTKNRDQPFFDALTLERFNKSNSFMISAGFCECGEWGGHDEEVKIFADSNSILYANHLVYDYNCDSARAHGYSQRLGISSTETVELNKFKKDCIVEFIQTMLNAKIDELPIQSHATNSYTASLSDSTLIISIADNSYTMHDNYKKPIKLLF